MDGVSDFARVLAGMTPMGVLAVVALAAMALCAFAMHIVHSMARGRKRRR